jgi:hypothetical protein
MGTHLINDIKAYALTNDDIQKVLEPETRILTYPQFGTMRHIDDAFDSLGRCIFLFLTESESSGHWICMWKGADKSSSGAGRSRPAKKGKTIHYWDSYGMPPGGSRSWLTPEKLAELNESEPYLEHLLANSGYRVVVNRNKYQKEKDGISTCGRWCLTRLVMKDHDERTFKQLIKQSKMAPDDFVAVFVADMLGK